MKIVRGSVSPGFRRTAALLAGSAALVSSWSSPSSGNARTAAASGAEPGGPETALVSAAARLTASLLIGGRAMDYTRELADVHWARLSGSEAHRRALEWAGSQFREIGLQRVREEAFTLPSGWERGTAEGRLLSPVARPILLASFGWSVPTPEEGIDAEVAVLRAFEPDRIRERASQLKGRIVLVDRERLYAESHAAAHTRLAGLPAILQEVGARALLMPGRESNNLLSTTALWGAKLSALPISSIGMEDARLIDRLLERGPVRLSVRLENRVSGPTPSANLIAELPGRERPDEWIIVGAHLDSWDRTPGAQDNAAGCGMVIDAARALVGLGQAPRRSIRFVLWGGEEEGLIGSMAYVRAHQPERGRWVAVLNADNGAGHPKGWKTGGREDLVEAIKPLSRRLLAGLGGDGVSSELTLDTDHAPFLLAGVPTLNLWVDMADYWGVHHKPADTFDKIDAHALADGAAILAVTAYALAERQEVLGPQLSSTQVGELLKKEKLEAFARANGLWTAAE